MPSDLPTKLYPCQCSPAYTLFLVKVVVSAQVNQDAKRSEVQTHTPKQQKA